MTLYVYTLYIPATCAVTLMPHSSVRIPDVCEHMCACKPCSESLVSSVMTHIAALIYGMHCTLDRLSTIRPTTRKVARMKHVLCQVLPHHQSRWHVQRLFEVPSQSPADGMCRACDVCLLCAVATGHTQEGVCALLTLLQPIYEGYRHLCAYRCKEAIAHFKR